MSQPRPPPHTKSMVLECLQCGRHAKSNIYRAERDESISAPSRSHLHNIIVRQIEALLE
jgi:hypothetical protein